MTNMQDTSLLAYEQVTPKIGSRQREVMQVFWLHPNCNFTNMELAQELGWSINRVTPRVKELREMKYLTKAGRRLCNVTHNLAYSWKLASLHSTNKEQKK